MKKTLFSVIAAVVFAFTAQAWAQQDRIVIATGDKKAGSVYSTMFNELSVVCSNGDWYEQPTTGGVQNKDLLIGNKVNGAWVQADMLEFERRLDPSKVEGIKTLIVMHDEELHFIARGSKSEGGIWGIGAKEVKLDSLASLKGRTVGAVGGSVASANVVSQNSGLNFKVLAVENNDMLKQKLLSGDLDAILVVGGAPHPLVASLPATFKILPIPQDLIAKLSESKLYAPAKLSYSNLGAAGVSSVSTQALFVTRVYRSAAMTAKLKEMRNCFKQKLGDIQDKIGTHPKWQFIKPDSRTGWPWYEL